MQPVSTVNHDRDTLRYLVIAPVSFRFLFSIFRKTKTPPHGLRPTAGAARARHCGRRDGASGAQVINQRRTLQQLE